MIGGCRKTLTCAKNDAFGIRDSHMEGIFPDFDIYPVIGRLISRIEFGGFTHVIHLLYDGWKPDGDR
jgi:hypothetical protein